MTHVDPLHFPELRRVFEGYLHEDFVAEHGTAAAAIEAFRADASAAEARAFRDEARRFLTVTSALDFAEVQHLVTRVGSRWIPGSRQELEAVLDATQG
jgi:contact-dependent growth inhibition (CDI) system CdiI-like immunity protein